MSLPLAITVMAALALLGLGLTYVLIPPIKRLARKHSMVSSPGGHSNHQHTTPVLGGLAVYIPFAVVFLGIHLLAWTGTISLGATDPAHSLSLFIATSWIMVLGTIDDKISMGWIKKLAGELVGVGILVVGGHTIANATIPFIGPVEFGWVGVVLFALAVLAITNAVNLIDGVDGLAGGICFFAALVSGIIGFIKADYITAAMGFVIAGSLLGFLRYNFPPASIFLGDGGSLMLGFLLGALATSSAALNPGQRSGTIIMVLVPLLPFGIALLDVILAIIRRSLSGRNIFSPDKEHLHHFMMEKIGHPRKVVLILYAFSLLLSVLTITLVLAPRNLFITSFMMVSGVIILAVLTILVRRYTIDRLDDMLAERAINNGRNGGQGSSDQD